MTGWETPTAREDHLYQMLQITHSNFSDSDLITLIGELEQEQASTALEQALIAVTVKVVDALFWQDAILDISRDRIWENLTSSNFYEI